MDSRNSSTPDFQNLIPAPASGADSTGARRHPPGVMSWTASPALAGAEFIVPSVQPDPVDERTAFTSSCTPSCC